MSQHHHSKGTILIELIVSTLVALVIGAALITVIQTNITSQLILQGQNNTDVQTRMPLDILCDNIRNAQPYGTYPAPVLQAAGSATVSCYIDTTGDYAKFWIDTSTSPATLKKTVGSTTTVLATGAQTLQFTYYVSGGNYTPASTSWVTTANPNAPTSGEIPNIAAIGISLTMSINGYTRTLSSLVRLRNSPQSSPNFG